MKSSEVRQAFLNYFEEQGHRIVSSSSLIPYHDPTILFANAGMNQFKDVFLGRERRGYSRATTSQKCMRVSGKHNDFEDVGRSFRHHTFFEMLGNFSFGDYFKVDAIRFAWELITVRYGLPKDRLYATVYEHDDEAYELWTKATDIRQDRIYRFGEKDNFWAMGETGPCGPCSELHYDFGQSPLGHTDCDLDCSSGRYVELWNLVFMQFNRDDSGKMAPLPAPSIDTGMGLERIATVLQGKVSNYDSDLFMPLIESVCQLTSLEYRKDLSTDISMRIIADHARAAAFLVSDGQYPGNDKRGYVLRKILRRAIVHGKKLGLQDPFLYRLSEVVADLMAKAYPELNAHRETVQRVIRGEEEAFANTLSSGLKEFSFLADTLLEKSAKVLPGDEAFFLYDTHGLPLETIKELCLERSLLVDEAAFHSRMEKQRDLSRQSQETIKGSEVAQQFQEESVYTGHERLTEEKAKVLSIYQEGERVQQLVAGQEGMVILDQTPFYAESGGQTGDRGVFEAAGMRASVHHTLHLGEKVIGHCVRVEEGALSVGNTIRPSVDVPLRQSTRRNHTATHLLHASLRRVLGEHVKQAGSLVSPDRLRFDFSHFSALTSEEILQIEDWVNRIILENRPVTRTIMALEEAMASGAMALFDEKYQESVSVIEVPGFSRELCGGTHVQQTGEIGLFKILSESSISSGIRRMEACTGWNSLNYLRKSDELVLGLCARLKSNPEKLISALDKNQASLRESQRRLEELQAKLGKASAGNLLEGVLEIRAVPVLAARIDGLAKDQLREMADQIRQRIPQGIVILGSSFEEKANLVVMIGEGKAKTVHAGKLIKEIARMVSGGGGGKPEMAEAGGKDPGSLDLALEKGLNILRDQLK